MRTARAVLVAFTAAVLSVGGTSYSVRADRIPLRSGTIAGGAGLELSGGDPWEQSALERSGCEYAVDCLAWAQSGCDPALAAREPAITASIVDVDNLADGTTRRSLEMTAPYIPPWGVFPGVVIQFWRDDCTEIAGLKMHSLGSDSPCDGHTGQGFGRCRFHIPAEARWMTLSGYATTLGLSWTLV